jgi:DNA-binding NarL/FixJ family response regulator
LEHSVLSVFVADDSPLIRERLAEAISAVAGTELVGQAEDALGAIEAIQRLQPDVAILDIRLAKGDGLQVLDAVKAGECSPVVIMLTAFPYPQYRTRCMEAGAAHFLDKATEFDQLPEVLEGLADRNPKHPIQPDTAAS